MLYLAAFFLFVGSALGQSQADYVIGPGDTLNIGVRGVDFGTEGLIVSSNGEVSFPYVGRIKLAGLTAFDAEQHLREVLQDGYLVNPQVTLRVTGFTSQRVELFGAVKTPGRYDLSEATTLRGLIAQAGGVDNEKSTGYIAVTRDGETRTFSVAELDTEIGEFPLRSGDVVDARQGNSVFLSGEVSQPGPVPFNRGLTASQALLMGGGTTEFGRLAGAYILRGEERIRVNLRRVIKGKHSDVELQPGDRIFIPMSPI